MFDIYSEVRAVLSSNVISAIEGCVIDTVKQYVLTADVEQVTTENETQYHLCGTLDGILVAKSKLEEFLNFWHIKQLEKESSDRETTTLSENSSFADEGNTSCDKEGSDKTSCLSDDKELETSNGNISTETSDKTLRLRSKRLRFVLKERPRVSQRLRSMRLPPQLRTLKKKSSLRNKTQKNSDVPRSDPEILSKNLAHMKLATEESDFDEAENKTYLSNDSQNSSSSLQYKHFCDLCSFKTKRNSHFVKHKAIHEKVNIVHKCSQCPFTSVRLSHLRRHEMSHSTIMHTCTECQYKADDIKLLRRHQKLKHPQMKESALVIKCPHCNYKTTKPHYYERHQRLHCMKRGLNHQCELCSYKTHRKEHYIRHVHTVHGDKRPYLCHVCGKSFKRGDALQQHNLVHSEVLSENANYKCSVCEKQFRSQSHLQEHRTVHSEFRSYLCEVCGAAFKTRSVHRKHMHSIHRNPRAYSCDLCSKKFSTMYTLNRHKKTHCTKPPPPLKTVSHSTNGSSDMLPSLCCSSTSVEMNNIPNSLAVQPMNPPAQNTIQDHIAIAAMPVSLPATPASGNLSQSLMPIIPTPDVGTVVFLARDASQS